MSKISFEELLIIQQQFFEQFPSLIYNKQCSSKGPSIDAINQICLNQTKNFLLLVSSIFLNDKCLPLCDLVSMLKSKTVQAYYSKKLNELIKVYGDQVRNKQ